MQKTKRDNSAILAHRTDKSRVLDCVLIVCGLCVFGCGGPFSGDAERLFPKGTVASANEVLRRGLTSEEPQIRSAAIEVVAKTRQMTLMPRVDDLLKDPYVPVRFAAVMAVGDTRYALARPKVEKLLEDPDENVRIAAAFCLFKLGSKEHLGIVRKAAVSSDQTARANAAVVLGKIGDKENLKILYWMKKDSKSGDKVRFQAAEAIAGLGDEKIYKKLWAMLISVYADDRVMGIRGMGALGTTQAQNALISKLDDDVVEVRLAAAEQLGSLGDKTGEPEVLDVFYKKLTDNLADEDLERVNVLTALAAGQIGTPAVARFLPRLLKDRSELVRIAAAKAVFQCQLTK